MTWTIEFLPEAVADHKKLDGSIRRDVYKVLLKVSQNPTCPHGYGKPLGNHSGTDLSGFYKIKLKASGIRIVYKLIKQGDKMLIVVIGVRDELEVYKEAVKRKIKYSL